MESTYLKKIKLTNYRQFIDQTITFNEPEKKNVFIIEGKNGTGKSNIFNAINWCMFEDEAHLGDKTKNQDICNTKQLKALKPGASIETSVEMDFVTSRGPVRISRSLKTYKEDDGTDVQGDSELKVFEFPSKGQTIISPNPQYVISRILPADMAHFFFIDGEKLRQMFEKINKNQIKDSIFNLSQVNLLQNAITHLTNTKAHFRTQRPSDEDPLIQQYEAELQGKENELERMKKKIRELKEEISKSQGTKKEIDEKLKKIGSSDLKKYQVEREFSDKEIARLSLELDSAREEYFKFLFELSKLLIFTKALKKTEGVIAELSKQKRLPPKIDLEYLKELIDSGKCMCGCSLAKDKEAAKALGALVADMHVSKFAELASTVKYGVRTIFSRVNQKDVLIRFADLPRRIKRFEMEHEREQKKYKELCDKIGGIRVEEVELLERMRTDAIEKAGSATHQVFSLEDSVRKLSKTIEEAQKALNRLSSKKGRYQHFTKKIQTCEDAISHLEELKTRLMGEIRTDTEKHMRDYFSSLVSAKDFEPPQITEDYGLELYNKDGKNFIHRLSAAETLCMGYSFMAALRQTSGFVAPIIVDTPLAKIDDDYTLNVARWMNAALPDAQIILLVTNKEYSAEFSAVMKKRLGGKYTISHNKAERCSEVKHEK